MSSETKPRPFLTYPVVIDWLQWADFPERIDEPDMPQVTLSLIKEYRDENSAMALAINAHRQVQDLQQAQIERLQKALDLCTEQRNDAIWSRFRMKPKYAKAFFADDLMNIMDIELDEILGPGK